MTQLSLPGCEPEPLTAEVAHDKRVEALEEPDRYVYQQLCKYETAIEDELDELERLHDRGGKLSPSEASDAFWRLESAGLISIDKRSERGEIRRLYADQD